MSELEENSLWKLLLLIRDFIKTTDADIPYFTAILDHDGQYKVISNSPSHPLKNVHGIVITNEYPPEEREGITAFMINDSFDFTIAYDHFLGGEKSRLLSLYLPVCFLPFLAKQRKRTATVLHLAQTLDGRIATNSGHSKWISNIEDLRHAHRMRSLCDAVLIGSNTLRIDKPHLNVRHVAGPNPVKIVIGNNPVEFTSLKEDGGKIMYLTPSKLNGYSGIEHIRMPSIKKQMSPSKILTELYDHGIYSLYIEGGSITASGFLQNHAVDLMQLYVAPKIFGSGISNFSLPEIASVENSISFHRSEFLPMGDGILFSGSLQH